MKTSYLILSLLLGFVVKAHSSIMVNSVYIEGMGMSLYGSLNYERLILQKGKWNFGLRAGISSVHFHDFTQNLNPDIILPFALNMYVGNSHHMEVGIGQTISNMVYSNPVTYEPQRKTNLSSNINIGYRYQLSKGGLLFRAGYTPVFERNKYFRNRYGVSVGWVFKSVKK